VADKRISELTVATSGQTTDAVAIARSGQSYQLAVSVLGPLIYKATTSVASSEELALFTTPKTCVPASSGNVIIPVRGHLAKGSGTAYTIGTATNLRFAWGNPIELTAMEAIPTASLASFFGSTGTQSALSLGPGLSGGAQFYNSICTMGSTTFFEQPISLSIQTANLTVGTASLTVNVFYQLWPLTL